jgi:hypothetical protein
VPSGITSFSNIPSLSLPQQLGSFLGGLILSVIFSKGDYNSPTLHGCLMHGELLTPSSPRETNIFLRPVPLVAVNCVHLPCCHLAACTLALAHSLAQCPEVHFSFLPSSRQHQHPHGCHCKFMVSNLTWVIITTWDLFSVSKVSPPQVYQISTLILS